MSNGTYIKIVPHEQPHICDPPSRHRIRRDNLGSGTIWQCAHCQKQWILTSVVGGYETWVERVTGPGRYE